MDALYVVLNQWERAPIAAIRDPALARAWEQIVVEDENTSYQCLGPVNKMVNQIARYIVEGRDSVAYREHERRREDFMWLTEKGMLMCGTNGSQLWDLAFITQAVVESGIAEDEANRASMIEALKWLDRGQIRGDPMHLEKGYRHTTKGAWGFSTKIQSYTVSDCTAEGLKAVLYLQDHLT
jgi:lanosterol synthase